jgi:hypothetical protein
MDIVQKAIKDLTYSIPKELLVAAFNEFSLWDTGIQANIDSKIRQEIIYGRIFEDVNVSGGQQIELHIGSVTPRVVHGDSTYDRGMYIYEIPKKLTDGRDIISVISLNYGPIRHALNGANDLSTFSHGTMTRLANQLIDTTARSDVLSTSNVTLISGNTILLRNQSPFSDQVFMLCNVSIDKDFSVFRASAYRKFGQLVEYAVKAYIYNKLRIPVGKGEIYAGVDLGVFKDELDNYSDSNEMYKEYLDANLSKLLFTSDDLRMESFIKTSISYPQ